MANRRMFSKDVVESSRFLKMPMTAQCLYFHLGINADDDGIVEAYNVMNMIRANIDDLNVLQGRDYVKILNSDYVTYIIHWPVQNQIRADRRRPSIYRDLLLSVFPDIKLFPCKSDSTANGAPNLIDAKVVSEEPLSDNGPPKDGHFTANGLRKESKRADNCQTNDCQMTAVCEPDGGKLPVQYSTGQYSTDQLNIGKCSEAERGIHDTLTMSEYNRLLSLFPKKLVDEKIRRINERPYKNCMNYEKIAQWCMEDCERDKNKNSTKRSFFYSGQREYDAIELERMLLKSSINSK